LNAGCDFDRVHFTLLPRLFVLPAAFTKLTLALLVPFTVVLLLLLLLLLLFDEFNARLLTSSSLLHMFALAAVFTFAAYSFKSTRPLAALTGDKILSLSLKLTTFRSESVRRAALDSPFVKFVNNDAVCFLIIFADFVREPELGLVVEGAAEVDG
jgi:hypothetical protein